MAGKSGAIKQGRAFVELFVDDSKLVRGLKKAEASVKQFGDRISGGGKRMMVAASSILAPLAAAAKIFAKQGAELKDMSMRTGIAVESLSAFEYVASQTGTSLESLEKGVRLSQKAMGDLTGQKALQELGINMAKLRALSPEDQFIAIADYIGKIPNQADRAAAAMKAFGKGGAELLPLMSEGAGGVRALMDEAKRLGIVMSTEDANAADALDDAMAKVGLQMKRMVGNVGGALAPVLKQLADNLSEIIPKVSEWIKNNQGLIVTVSKTAGYVMAFGVAMFAVGKGISVIAAGIGVFRLLFTSISGLIGIVKASGPMWAGLGVLMANPFLYLAVILAVVLDTCFGIFDGLREILSNIREDFSVMVDGIASALENKKIDVAGEILWTGLKLMWAEGTRELLRMWRSLVNGMSKAVIAISNLFDWGEMQELWAAVDANAKAQTLADDKRIIDLKKQLLELNEKAKQKNAPAANITAEIIGDKYNIGTGGDGVAKQNSVMGSFYANQVLSLSAGGESTNYAKRTATAAERTAEAVEEIADNTGGAYGV